MYDAMGDAFVFICNIMWKHKMTAKGYNNTLKAIIKSNFTKFCKTEDEAIETVAAYRKGTHPNKFGTKIASYYTINKGFYIVRAKSDTKILKSINFKDTENFL